MTSPMSLTKKGPDGISGSNYYLPIYHDNKIDTLLWMFDSHDDSC